MLITCTNCATSYQVTGSSLGSTGRSVRCVRCQHVWFAANTEALVSVAAAHRVEVAEFSAHTSIAGLADLPPPPAQRSAPADDNADAAAAEPDPVPGPELDQKHGRNVNSPAPDFTVIEATPAPEPAAELAAVTDAPPLAPAAPNRMSPPLEEPPPLEDIETVAARRARLAKRRQGRLKPSLTTAILALIAINIGLIGWRSDVVRWLPQTASLYARMGLPVNLRGLVFAKVATEKENQDGIAVLVVEGTIANATARPVEVPRLRFALRNSAGQEVYSWTALPTKSALTAGETLEFRSRLASPPHDASQVLVRFFNRRDLVAGLN